MFEIIKSGGWLMLPIVLSSVIALAITVERYWTLRVAKVRPKEQLPQVWLWIKNQELDANKIKELKHSPALHHRTYRRTQRWQQPAHIIRDEVATCRNS